MADFLKCQCSHCGAKYRLPMEAQGRSARCKKCGQKFSVPRQSKTLEDNVQDWLAEGEDESSTVEAPRVISMPQDSDSSGGSPASRRKGPIRMKTTGTAPNHE